MRSKWCFDGADGAGRSDKTPDFVKSMPVWKALDENTMLAFEMNGEPLPHWNGFPVRLIVPGWTGTYWMKHVISIIGASAKPFTGFWMDPAYRIPTGKFPIVDRSSPRRLTANTPITEIVVNSLITSIRRTAARAVQATRSTLRGIAWDGGYGIRRRGGVRRRRRSPGATPSSGSDLGRFSFRAVELPFRAVRAGQAYGDGEGDQPRGATQTWT